MQLEEVHRDSGRVHYVPLREGDPECLAGFTDLDFIEVTLAHDGNASIKKFDSWRGHHDWARFWPQTSRCRNSWMSGCGSPSGHLGGLAGGISYSTGQRIERAVTIKAVIAWRLAAMTLLGPETPELPAEVFFTHIQMRVLRHFAASRGLAAPGNLGLAVRTMAILGGYLYRKNAPPPGHQKIWEGWTRLTIMAEAYELKDRFEPPQTASQNEP